MELEPSFPLVEVRYFIPCAPAPVYPLDTETWGGARSGNCETGSVGITAAPARMISRAQTVAKTGRRMKKSTNIRKLLSPFQQSRSLDSANLPPAEYSSSLGMTTVRVKSPN